MKVDSKNIEDILHLTSLQEGMLYRYLNRHGGQENMDQVCLSLSGAIDPTAFRRAWDSVVQSNEMLRTIFEWEGMKNPIQVILRKVDADVRVFDFSETYDPVLMRQRLDGVVHADLKEYFDLRQPSFRVTLCIMRKKYMMIVSNHHILFDGWSRGLILKEFVHHYLAILGNAPLPVITKTRFNVFLKETANDSAAANLAFWKEILAGYEPVFELPYEPNGRLKGKFDSIKVHLDRQTCAGIPDFLKRHELTFATLFYGLFGILLQKYNDCRDVVLAAVVSGRGRRIPGIEAMVGLMINTLPLRIRSDSNTSFIDLLNKVQSLTLSDQYGSNISLSEIKRCIGLMPQHEFFNLLVGIDNFPVDQSVAKNSEFQIDSYTASSRTSYDLTVMVSQGDEVRFEFVYNAATLNHRVVKLIASHAAILLRKILDNPHASVDRAIIMTEEEERSLKRINETTTSYPSDKTVHELFDEVASDSPGKMAVVFEDQQFTYGFLRKRSIALASHLIEKGLTAEDVVPVISSIRAEIVIACLAILRAGGAFLLLDPLQQPDERLHFILGDINGRIVITNDEFQPLIARLRPQNWIVPFSSIDRLKHDHDDESELGCRPDNIAYIIYTSGTTGFPKGILIEHRSVIRLVRNTNYIGSFTDHRLMLTSALGFDATIFSIWSMLLNGGTLCLRSLKDIMNNEVLEMAIRKEKITTLMIPTSWHNQIVDEAIDLFRSISHLFVGGERMSPRHISVLKGRYPSMRVINAYGPAENTVFSTTYLIPGETENEVPIGTPTSNSSAYVLNSNLQFLPIAVKGELCVGGDGLARGYLNQPELTASKFVPLHGFGTERVYRTGDYARWKFDGNLQFEGRQDTQVKIRGNRVELLEIQNRIKSFNGIRDAIVTTRMNASGEKMICAYLVWADNNAIDGLRSYLTDFFPSSILPSHFIDVKGFTLTLNGKVDIASLPDPFELLMPGLTIPATETETKLLSIWSEILELNTELIDLHSSFFQLGGHSLSAIRVVSRINKFYKCELTIDDIFRYPTISELAGIIDGLTRSGQLPLRPAQAKDQYAITPSQKMLFILQSLNPESTAYNMPYVADIFGEVDKEKMSGTFNRLIERHEILRTYFQMSGDEPIQRIAEKVSITITDLEPNGDDQEPIIRSFLQPFNLNEAPLLRAGIIRITERHHVLIVDTHHIISDRPSQQILIRDFATLYSGSKLEPVNIHFKDFCEWRTKNQHADKNKKTSAYWDKQLAGGIPLLNLPYDFPRPSFNKFSGGKVQRILADGLDKKIDKVLSGTNTTMYVFFLSCYYILLQKLSGQDDILIGTPVDVRNSYETEGIVGMFVNTFPIRNHPSRNKRFSAFLSEVRESCSGFLENQDIEYEVLAKYHDQPRDMSRNPLFDVVLAFEKWSNSGFQVDRQVFKTRENFDHGISKFDLTLNINHSHDCLTLTFEYNSALFKYETVNRFIDYYERIILGVIHDVDVAIGKLNHIPASEAQFVLNACEDKMVEYPEEPLNEMFRTQAQQTPDAVAMISSDQYITYAELAYQSRRLACDLMAYTRDQHIIGVNASRSVDLVVRILGILESGAAYLPIDFSLPDKRVDQLIQDSSVKTILGATGNWLYADLDANKPAPVSGETVPRTISTDDLAYVLFTSGSTGVPKGVMIDHRSVANIVNTVQDLYPVNRGDSYLFKSPVTFDFSVAELFAPLLKGGKIVVVPEGSQADGGTILSMVELHKISHITFVPSMFNAFMDFIRPESVSRLSTLRYVFLGGEAVSKDLLDKFDTLGTSSALENMYGPTETTVYASKACLRGLKERRRVPIGKPLPNAGIIPLATEMELQAIGVPGELFIWGKGVARGYLNRPELTAQKFTNHPYIQNARGYKTGDLGYVSAEGELFYCGRADDQVKIRGYRVEPGEIEQALRKFDRIREVVVAYDETRNTFYVFFQADSKIKGNTIKNYLKQYLPYYMVPENYLQVESLPRTGSG